MKNSNSGRFLTAFLILVALCLSGCQQSNQPELQKQASDTEPSVHMLITKAYGSEVLIDTNIAYTEDFAVLDYLESAAEVETAYGGGFVNAIEGYRSGYTDQKDKIKRDWFYTVNGIFSHMGALDYYPEPGDQIHWDYHDWDKSMSASASVSGYPIVLKQGFDTMNVPTVIVCQDTLRESAQIILESLDPLALDIEIQTLTDDFQPFDTSVHTLVLADLETIGARDDLKSVLDDSARMGHGFELDQTALTYCDSISSTEARAEKYAVMFAEQKTYAEPATLFILTGSDAGSVARLVEYITANPDTVKGAVSLLIESESGHVVRLP